VPAVPDPVCAVAAVIEVEGAEAPEPVSVAPVAAVLSAALFEATALALAGGVEEGEDPSGVRDALCAVYARSREDGLLRSGETVVEMKLAIINPTPAISISLARGRTPL
jgi:hypothetical protein